ncbi:MAG TPA: antitoxin Xre/MbcA/ParS toxin-binding domain-containing protein [Verrucomicrobiae bacterium]|nr:antitoxin Xre/MbcA/ParS toxin-binding domain-containing protein [Verrucomicrobiae bacterium]
MSTTLAKPQGRKTARGKSGNGVVGFYVHGPTGKTAEKNFAPSNLVELLKVGLPVTELTDLQESLAVPTEKLAPMLGISKATFHRRKGTGERLDSAESDRVVRFARLFGQAIRVMGDEEDARQWLNSPQFGLGGAVPLDYAKTEVGAREVENLLGRIEHGVYS